MLKNLEVGIDIVNIGRFKKMPYHTNKQFYKKIFNSSEIKYCLKYSNPSPHFAGKFAIKESVVKAIREKLSFLDIQTSYDSLKPIVRLRKKNTIYDFLVSVSHEKNYAVAIVIVKKR